MYNILYENMQLIINMMNHCILGISYSFVMIEVSFIKTDNIDTCILRFLNFLEKNINWIQSAVLIILLCNFFTLLFIYVIKLLVYQTRTCTLFKVLPEICKNVKIIQCTRSVNILAFQSEPCVFKISNKEVPFSFTLKCKNI